MTSNRLLSGTSAFESDKSLLCKAATRFWSRTAQRPNGCIEWVAGKFATGYGAFQFAGKLRRAHRVAWELTHGPIADGLDVLHKCDNPPCVNPDHLFLGTDKDNHQDKTRKGRHPQARKTHCPKGHPYDESNTYRTPQGSRACRACKGMPPLRTGNSSLQERVSQ